MCNLKCCHDYCNSYLHHGGQFSNIIAVCQHMSFIGESFGSTLVGVSSLGLYISVPLELPVRVSFHAMCEFSCR